MRAFFILESKLNHIKLPHLSGVSINSFFKKIDHAETLIIHISNS